MKTMQKSLNKAFGLATLLAFTMGSTSLLADAGKSLFVYGKVELHEATGQVNKLTKGATLEEGDKVVTGINGRTQLRMTDGAIFDLKPNTEFLISEYKYEPTEFQGRKIASDDSKGFYKLVRGGFRAISGAIGKKNKKNYKVTTPVATIGIRGTDYTLVICESACSANGLVAPRGLYASVLEGGITLDNAGGVLNVDPGEYAYVANVGTAPVFTASQVTASTTDEEAAEPSIVRMGEDAEGNELAIEAGVEPVIVAEPVELTAARAAYTSGSQVGLAQGELSLDPSGRAINAYVNDSGATVERATAESINRGEDQSTGLYWGRWANGASTTTQADGTASVNDLNESSAHWIHASNQIKPELPLTGTASFALVGNTNPTDNMGNRGVLGSANLAADFTNQTVDADVNLSINEQTWDASGSGALNGEAATFAGDFNEVTVTNDATGAQHAGEGEFAGFFTADDDGDLAGAGMTYSLSDDESTVEGAAAFELENEGNNP